MYRDLVLTNLRKQTMTLDELFEAAAYMSVDMQEISSELIKNKFFVNRSQSKQIIDHLERAGIIVPENIEGDKIVCISNIYDLEKILSVYIPSILLDSKYVIYNLIIWNDDVNRFNDVVFSLETVLKSNTKAAFEKALLAHKEGSSIVKTGSLEKLLPIKDFIQERKITASILAII